MKRRLLVVCLVIVSIVAMTLGIVGCGQKSHTHSFIYHEQKSASCTQEGNIEYWECVECGKLFSDAYGNNEITDTIVPSSGHIFSNGYCVNCGAEDPNYVPPEPEDPSLVEGKQLQNIQLTNGILSWDKLKIASKYSISLTVSGEDQTYELDAKTGTFDFSKLPDDNKLAYGKNYAKLTVYEYQTETVAGETVGTDVPIDSDSFIVVYRNAGYTLVRTTYTDERISIEGAYSDIRSLDGMDFIFIEQVLESGTDSLSFNLSKKVDLSEGVTAAFYKSDSDRKNNRNPISGFDWYTQEVKAGNNRYYVRTSDANGDLKDYNINICCVRTIKIDLLGFERNKDGSYSYPSYSDLLPSSYVVEGDYFDVGALYDLLPEGKTIFGEDNVLYELGEDYTYPMISDNTYTFLAVDTDFYNDQQEEAGLYSDIFELTYNINFGGNPYWLLVYKNDSDATSIVVPSAIYGDSVKLTAQSFKNASSLKNVIFQTGFTSLPTGMFLNGCTSLQSVSIPASVTDIEGNGSMFSADLYDNLKIYCEGVNPDTNNGWDRVPGEMKLFKVYTNQTNACSTLRIDGLVFVVNADGNATLVDVDKQALPTGNIYIPDTVKFGIKTVPVTAVADTLVLDTPIVNIGKNIAYLSSYNLSGNEVTAYRVSEENENYAAQNGILYTKDYSEIVCIPKQISGAVIFADGVTSIPNDAFLNNKRVTSVTLPSSVLHIGDRAFYGTVLPSVALPQGLISIGSEAFASSGIESMTIPSSVTVLGNGAFASCAELGAIYIFDLVQWCGFSFEASDAPLKNAQLYLDGQLVTAVSIPSGVTEIGAHVFSGASSITSLDLNEVISVGAGAFSHCSNLVTVDLKNVQNIGGYAFAYTAITSLDIPDTVTVISSEAFYSCVALKSVDLGKVQEIQAYAFANTSISVLDIPDTVRAIGSNAFENCKIVELVIPASAEVGSNAFQNCNYLEKLTLPKINNYLCEFFGGKKYTDYGYVPASLKTVTLTSATEIPERAFYGCASLEYIILPDSVSLIEDYAFQKCTNLKSFTIPYGITEKTALGDAILYQCDNMQSLIVTDTTLYDYLGRLFGANTSSDSADRVPSTLSEVTVLGGARIQGFEYCANIKVINLPESGITSVGNFYNCSDLIYINIPDTVTELGSFKGCSSLVSLNIPCNLGGWFEGLQGCESLQSITIGPNVTKMEASFSNCTSLEKVYIKDISKWCAVAIGPNSSDGSYNSPFYYGAALYDADGNIVTDLVIPESVAQISKYAFYGCSSLKSVSVSASDICNRAFAYCSSLTSVTIGNGEMSILGDAFYGCYKLVEVYNLSTLNITKGSSSNGYVAYYAINVYTTEDAQSNLQTTDDGYIFYEDGETIYLIGYTGAQTELTLPETFNGKNYQIYNYAFYKCSSLTSITIPDSVTSIGSNAFYGCSVLTNITIPDSVKSIGSYAFYNCGSLTSVTFENTSSWWVSTSSSATSGTTISESDLADPSTAANYLKSTYYKYYWKRG